MSDWSDAAFVLDLSFWAHKAWHAVARDAPKDRVPAMFPAFANMVVKLLADHDPRYLFVAAETGGPTWRHALYPAYKADRAPHPPGFDAQLLEAIRHLELHRFPVLGAAGFEADDVIATIVRRVRAQGVPVVVITADKDLRQLVTDAEPAVVLWDGKDRWVGERTVKSDWSIAPHLVADLLALTGDDGDGIPGIPGVGPVNAARMLARAAGVEKVIAHHDWWTPKLGAAVRAHAAQIRLARQLVELRDAPIPVDLESARVLPERYDRPGLLAFYEERGLTRLAGMLV